MAIRYAVANGNWSDVATWDGGVSLPTHGDTVYANNRTVTIDQAVDIGDTGISVNAGSFIVGHFYVITSIGTTNFTTIGASANTVGLPFIATGVGTGTGTADARGCLFNAAVVSPAITAGGGFTVANNFNIRSSILGGHTTSTLTISGNSSLTITGIVGMARASGAAVNVTTGGTINFVGDVYGGTGGSGAAVNFASAITISTTLTGNIIGATTSGSRAFTVGSNGTVTINGNITAGTTSNTSGLYLTTGVTTTVVTGNVTGGGSGSAEGILFTAAAGSTLTVNGNLSGGTAGPGISNNAASGTVTINGNSQGGNGGLGFSNSAGTATITGTVTGGSGSGSHGLTIGGGTVIISGQVTGGSSASSAGVSVTAGSITINNNVLGATGPGVSTATTGTTLIVNGNVIGSALNNGITYDAGSSIVTVTGNVTGGTATNIYGIAFNANAGTLTVNGNVTGGSGANAFGISGPATTNAGTIIINGNVTATSTSNAIRSTSTSAANLLSFNGNIIDHVSGMKAIAIPRWYYTSTPSNKSMTVSIGGLSTYTMYSNDTWNSSYPAVGNVRAGLSYGAGGVLTGTLNVPPAGSVALGVPVDNTTGTAYLTSGSLESGVRSALGVAAANLDTQIANIPSAVRTNLATELARIDVAVSSVGGTAPTAEEVADAVRSELATELGRIDAAISTRLSEAGYTAPPTTSAIATAVEAALLNEGDGQQLIDAILQVINMNLDLPALELTAIANAVRSELATELARIDAAISSRSTLTAGGVRTELATELARIDVAVSSAGDPATIAEAVRTELTPELARVANCSTVDTTGAQLAAIL